LNIDAEPYAISAVSGRDIRLLLYRAAQLLEQARQQPSIPASPAGLPVYRVESDPKAFTVAQTSDGWQVHGQAIERAASMTYWEHYESVRRFQRILEVLGVDKALREAGVQEGDTVMIGEYELEWQD
jgi:GTP-binding protein